jgi:PAS domain S-box-containing protein
MTYGVNRDITDLKRNEQRVTESEGQFKSLVEQQVAGIVIVRYDGSLAYVNPRFAGMLGYETKEVIGQPLLSFIAERDRNTIMDRTRARFAGQSDKAPSAFAIRTRAGTLVDVLGQSTLATWQGHPALIGVVIDYSEHKQAERAMQQAIEALAGTVELRDPYTAGHQRRVSRLACAIAHKLGMPESQIAGLQLASAVHDIGKVLVPAEILAKPGKLTDIEYQMIQQHAEAGYDILKGVEFPWPVAQIILQHHERLDGSGYPRGLARDAILQEAKVLTVADVLDAMMTRRPYREGLGLEAALREIETGKGKLYDPAAVDACVSLFRQKAFSFE